MKESPKMQQIQNNMRPGAISLRGFLGNDTRSLTEILDSDQAEVARLGLTHQDIAERMQHFRDAGMAGLGEFCDVDGHFEVRVDSVRGKLPCPFEHAGVYRKTNITVRNKALDKVIRFTDFHIHLINQHGFYEGKGSDFRLEPAQLKEILEVTPAE